MITETLGEEQQICGGGGEEFSLKHVRFVASFDTFTAKSKVGNSYVVGKVRVESGVKA